MGAARFAFEADGKCRPFYFETGNGSGGAPVLNASGFPTNANYNDALVKVEADSTTSPSNQNANGWGFRIADYLYSIYRKLLSMGKLIRTSAPAVPSFCSTLPASPVVHI